MHTEQEENVGDNLGGMEAVSPTEIAERTSGERGQRGEDEGRGVSFVINETGAWAFRSTHRWKRWAMIGRPSGTTAAETISIVPEFDETPEYPEWVWKVMAQSASNEMVTCIENARSLGF